VIVAGRGSQKQVCPRVNEQRYASLICYSPDRLDATALSFYAVQSVPGNDAILEIDAYDAQIQQPRDISGQSVVVVTVTAFEIDCDWNVYGGNDPRDDLLDQVHWDPLTISITLSRCHRPTARGDRGRSSVANGFGAACVPGVVEHQRGTFDMQRCETFGFFE